MRLLVCMVAVLLQTMANGGSGATKKSNKVTHEVLVEVFT